MIRPITKQLLHTIKNKSFIDYAQIYLQREVATISHLSSFGVPFANKTTTNKSELKMKELHQSEALIRNNGKSIVSNDKISPSCLACQTGTGSFTTYTSLKCHRNCYFCFNPNQDDYAIYKDSKKDLIKELKNMIDLNVELDHLALTGGEPLLFKDEMIEFFAYANKKSPETYTRLYTTGDLFDEITLEKLRDVNLNEVRFSIKMDDSKKKINHTLKQIKLAKKYIPVILVEMPVIPGLLAEMKELLRELDEIGIFGINLLEFCFPLVNAEEFTKRDLKLKNPPYEVFHNYWYAGGLAVDDSEVECLELVQFAIEENLNLGVHYCSLENKHTGQIYQQNARAPLSDMYIFSERDYFIKTAKVFGKDIKTTTNILDKNSINYEANSDYDFVQFPISAIKLLKNKNINIAISSNVFERDTGGSYIKEVGIGWTTPDFFKETDV